MSQEILTGPERRRWWSREQKIAIVMEAGQPGASVAGVARHHDITRQHIYQWRAAMRRGELDGSDAGGFLEVRLDEAGAQAPDHDPDLLDGPDPRSPARVEIAEASCMDATAIAQTPSSAPSATTCASSSTGSGRFCAKLSP